MDNDHVEDAMQKWEYITIRQSCSAFGGAVHYISPDGKEVKQSGADLEGRTVHQLLNLFGEQGYELIGADTSDTHVSIYTRFWVLKTPKNLTHAKSFDCPISRYLILEVLLADFITLSCPSCGNKLQITEDIDGFACSACGIEYMVNRGEGIISLNYMKDYNEKTNTSADKTTSVLGMDRLKKEIKESMISQDLIIILWRKGNKIVIGGLVNNQEAFDIAHELFPAIYSQVRPKNYWEEKYRMTSFFPMNEKMTPEIRRFYLEGMINSNFGYVYTEIDLTEDFFIEFNIRVDIPTIKDDLKEMGFVMSEFNKMNH